MTKLTGELVYARDPGCEAARQNLIKPHQSYPLVIVFARQVQDVRNAIQWSSFSPVDLGSLAVAAWVRGVWATPLCAPAIRKKIF